MPVASFHQSGKVPKDKSVTFSHEDVVHSRHVLLILSRLCYDSSQVGVHLVLLLRPPFCTSWYCFLLSETRREIEDHSLSLYSRFHRSDITSKRFTFSYNYVLATYVTQPTGSSQRTLTSASALKRDSLRGGALLHNLVPYLYSELRGRFPLSATIH